MSHLKYETKGQSDYIEDATAQHIGPEATRDGDVDKSNAMDLQNMDATDRYTALKLAHEADPGPPIASGRFLLFCFYVFITCMCSGDSGFDGTVMSSVNSMTQFQTYFDLQGAATKTGIVFGIYTVGQVCAFFPASLLPDLIGRRYAMMTGNAVLVAGALISSFSTRGNMGMFIGGRFLTGFGCTLAATAAKSYLTEITAPMSRGRWMGFLNSFYYIGQIIASGIAIPFGRDGSDWAWRAPILLQAMFAAVNIFGAPFLPESPRWLYTRGHQERAIKTLTELHSKNRDPNSPLIQLQIQEIEENISLSGADKRWWDFRAIFNSAANRYRFGLCVIISVWGQLSGNGLITYFLPILLGQAGITDPDRQRVLNFVNSITSWIGALSGTAIVDHVGRRPLLLTAEICCMSGMAIVAGLLSPAGPQNGTRATAGISFIYLFMVLYSFGITPLQALYPAEVLSFENRAKGLALQGWVTNAVSLINTFGMPVALAALTWKTYIIFAVWDVVGIVVIYFFVVETKQLSLEDMDVIFDSPNPKRTSLRLKKEAKERARQDREARGL